MREYEIEFEIFQGKGGKPVLEGEQPNLIKEGICAWMYYANGSEGYKVGDKFRYPDDLGKLCPWMVDSLTGVVRALEHGGTLPWRYKDTPFEKQIDPDGVTTEFVRCIDPTACGIVMKVIRRALPE